MTIERKKEENSCIVLKHSARDSDKIKLAGWFSISGNVEEKGWGAGCTVGSDKPTNRSIDDERVIG